MAAVARSEPPHIPACQAREPDACCHAVWGAGRKVLFSHLAAPYRFDWSYEGRGDSGSILTFGGPRHLGQAVSLQRRMPFGSIAQDARLRRARFCRVSAQIARFPRFSTIVDRQPLGPALDPLTNTSCTHRAARSHAPPRGFCAAVTIVLGRLGQRTDCSTTLAYPYFQAPCDTRVGGTCALSTTLVRLRLNDNTGRSPPSQIPP